MKPHVVDEQVEKKHGALVGRTLPLLGGKWRQDTLVIKDPSLPERARRHTDTELLLTTSDRPSLSRIGAKRISLAYAPASLEIAHAALLAASTRSGMPIAGDVETLALLELAQRIGSSEIPVLIEGPTGTGKEVLAKFLHRVGPRADGPFIPINCAALPETMLEALLFGHKKGAFTGASESGEGFFRAANGGVLLLDEIGEMPLALQAKLLRVLQEGEVVPIGSTTPVPVDVRVIACTNRSIPEEIAAGRFREDLYYRLNVFPLRLPALIERPMDIAPLAFGMLLKYGCTGSAPSWISDEAIAMLMAHDWPGNIRELENVMRRAMLLGDGCWQIETHHIQFDNGARLIARPRIEPSPPTVQPTPARGAKVSAKIGDSLSDIAFESEAQAIREALAECSGHRGQTAQKLGISERTLRYRLSAMRDAGLLELEDA